MSASIHRSRYRAPCDPYHIHTEPGSGGAMAPPDGSVETPESYRQEMLKRFRRDPEARQCMLIAARRFDPDPTRSPITFHGRYCDWARTLIATLHRQMADRREENAA